MTVAELIEELQYLDPNLEVKISYNYGDYWHTMVAKDIRCVEDAFIEYSDYHRMDKVVESEDEDEDSDGKMVILLS